MAKNSNGGSPRGKLLRIGVVQDNKIIKEDLNWDRTGVTVGGSTKTDRCVLINTFKKEKNKKELV